jgi:glutathione synthase/RimK-type ligase-like ATP-grasp enzyme
VSSKWAKTKALLRSQDLRLYVPVTKRFSRKNFRSMLEQYGMVYVKPIDGMYGDGVIRVEMDQDPSAGYRYQIQKVGHEVPTFDELYRELQRYTSRKGYLVQKGIHLLKHKRRRFDLRVMIQQSPSNRWETTGIIGRLAHPRNAVTNYHSGGTMVSFEELMSGHLSDSGITAFRKRLKQLGASIGRQLGSVYPGLKELGADIAIDKDFHPWVLEVNTKPHPYIFNKLKDKTMHRKVMRYFKAYGGGKARRS